MDLSWCIICDKRIEDDELSMLDSNTSLYCSQGCKLKDNGLHEEPLPLVEGKFNKFIPIKKPRHSHYRPSAPTTSYPWIPLYRKRHNSNHLFTKRCQPVIAGSPITTTASTLII